MEDHDEAYLAWKEKKIRDRVLLHFDAHIDFGWIAPVAGELLEERQLEDIFTRLKAQPFWNLKGQKSEGRIHLGNYIHEAIRSGMIREFIWIYPDDPDLPKQAREVRLILNGLSQTAPLLFQLAPQTSFSLFEGAIFGRPFRALPFSSLPQLSFREEILLDIDLDFLIVQSLHSRNYPYTDLNHPRLWLSPESFCEKIKTAGFRPCFTTIAYSIEEGYTPLAMKFLGDELAGRLSGALSKEESETFEILRGTLIPSEENRDEKISRLENLAARSPGSPVHFNLAILLLEKGRAAEAKAHYQRAVELDPSYRTAYNHAGPALLNLGMAREAGQSFERMKLLDETNPHVLLYEIEKLMRKKQWREVLRRSESLLLPDNGVDPVLRLFRTQCLLSLRRDNEARQELSFYKGREDARYFALCARLAERRKDYARALEAHSQLIWDSPVAAHVALARLYSKKGNFYKARRHLGKALRLLALLPFYAVIKWKRRLAARA